MDEKENWEVGGSFEHLHAHREMIHRKDGITNFETCVLQILEGRGNEDLIFLFHVCLSLFL